MPFDPDQYLSKKSPAFDPDKYISTKQSQGSSASEAALQGFGKAATLGYLPQLQAATGKAIEALTPESDIDKKLKEQGFNVQPKDQSYTEMRDQYIARQQALEKEHPIASTAGQLGGLIATAPAMGGLIGKAAPTVLGRLGQAAKMGAITGAAENPGDTKGEVSPLQLKERGEGAISGGITGALGQQLIGEPLSKASQALSSFAQEKAVKSAGAMLKDFRRIFGKDRVGELSNAMYENGLVKPGFSFSDVADKSSQLKQQAGEEIGKIYDQVRNQVGQNPEILEQKLNFLNPASLKAELEHVVADPKVMPKLGADKYESQMSSFIDDILGKKAADKIVAQKAAQNPDLQKLKALNPDKYKEVIEDLSVKTQHSNLADVRNLNDIIGEIDKKIKWSKRTPEMSDMEQGLYALRSKLRDTVNKTADAVSSSFIGEGHPLSSQLKVLNKKYGNLAEINSMAEDRVAREAANRWFSPSDYGSAAAGAAIGAMTGENPEQKLEHAAIGAGLGMANKAARLYALPALATGANKAAGLIPNLSPGLIGSSAERLKQMGRK